MHPLEQGLKLPDEAFFMQYPKSSGQLTNVIRPSLNYSRVWNKRTPLNKRSPLENLAKRIIVAPFLPYTMKSEIRP